MAATPSSSPTVLKSVHRVLNTSCFWSGSCLHFLNNLLHCYLNIVGLMVMEVVDWNQLIFFTGNSSSFAQSVGTSPVRRLLSASSVEGVLVSTDLAPRLVVMNSTWRSVCWLELEPRPLKLSWYGQDCWTSKELIKEHLAQASSASRSGITKYKMYP